MTIFYSKSTKGFYDSEVHINIPSDAVEITKEAWISLINAQSNGKQIQANKKGFPVAVDPTISAEDFAKQCKLALRIRLDEIAIEWGYDSIISAISYANSTNSQYKSEAKTLIEWRDKCWDKAYTIEAGVLPPTAEAFVGMLPAAPTKPVV